MVFEAAQAPAPVVAASKVTGNVLADAPLTETVFHPLESPVTNAMHISSVTSVNVIVKLLLVPVMDKLPPQLVLKLLLAALYENDAGTRPVTLSVVFSATAP